MPVITTIDTTAPGTMVIFTGETSQIPPGYLLCDGSEVSRTTYPNLWLALQGVWGTGDGVNTFHLPDMRGRFPRGVDDGNTGVSGRDPDAGSRSFSNTGGNAGNLVGSVQTNAFGDHDHDGGIHSHSLTAVAGPNLAAGAVNYAVEAGGSSYTGEDSTSTIVSQGEGDTRPENANVYYIIKF